MKKLDSEKIFLSSFKDLISTFAEEVKKTNSHAKSMTVNDLQNILESNTLITKISFQERMKKNPVLDRKFKDFMNVIENIDFRHGIIPYDKITECVFEETPEEMLYSLTSDLHSRGSNHFSVLGYDETNPEKEKIFYKILRHIDLALIQKHRFATIKLKEMEKLKQDYESLNKQYEELKENADKQYRSMLTQFISILGIFSAIMMGAFGAIQSFANLFNNAKDISMGKILIISSIGASSVILILFFLLNGIAKLTDRSLANRKKEDSTLPQKYPSLLIIHGMLILIVLIGASLELSNIKIQFALQGFWWLLPLFWLAYLLMAFNKKSLWPFENWFKKPFKRKRQKQNHPSSFT